MKNKLLTKIVCALVFLIIVLLVFFFVPFFKESNTPLEKVIIALVSTILYFFINGWMINRVEKREQQKQDTGKK